MACALATGTSWSSIGTAQFKLITHWFLFIFAFAFAPRLLVYISLPLFLLLYCSVDLTRVKCNPTVLLASCLLFFFLPSGC